MESSALDVTVSPSSFSRRDLAARCLPPSSPSRTTQNSGSVEKGRGDEPKRTDVRPPPHEFSCWITHVTTKWGVIFVNMKGQVQALAPTFHCFIFTNPRVLRDTQGHAALLPTSFHPPSRVLSCLLGKYVAKRKKGQPGKAKKQRIMRSSRHTSFASAGVVARPPVYC